MLFLISVALPLAASARIVESGECGFNRTWTLDDSGLLIISGKGPVIKHPWDSSKVIKVVIESGITKIGNSVFEKCNDLNNITIPKSVTSIGNKTFPMNNSNLTIQCYFDSTAYEYAKSNNINVVLLDEEPVITSQPSDVVAGEGETATFKIVAIGATEYQWYYRTSSTAPWEKIAKNGGSASISFKVKNNYNKYQFFCMVKRNTNSVRSQIVTLEVISNNPTESIYVKLVESKSLTIGTTNDKIQKIEAATVIPMSGTSTEASNVKFDESKPLNTGTNNEKLKTAESETRNTFPLLISWLELSAVILLALLFSISKIQRSHVKHYSPLYNELLSLNKKYSFYRDIPNSYSLIHNEIET